MSPFFQSFAHAKGILVTSAEGGFWLVHSMPEWPNYFGNNTNTTAPSLTTCVRI